ncbi:alpha/beta fold hydrolase [Bacteroidota bacterium]
MDNYKFTFPVEYFKFHKEQVFNFQLNRWYSWGYTLYEDMEEAGRKVKNFEDWKKAMLMLAAKAEAEDRPINAAFYYRAAEFYTFKDEPDKEELYYKFNEAFYSAFKNDEIKQFKIPYEDSFLPAIRVQPSGIKKGTIVLHGGFDSFMEEFYSWMLYFSDFGYEVIAFEGPGQGSSRIKYGLTITIEWEKPVKALLDFLKLDDVTLIGLSMGGFFCLRAAAFEPRIKRVIANGHAIDYMQSYGTVLRVMHEFFIKKFSNYSNKLILKAIKKRQGMQAWFSAQLMDITGKDLPMDAFVFFLQMNKENQRAELIKQDVFIISSESDHFVPIKMHKKQLEALTNAKSVTDRIFKKEEHAHNHCQVGNVGLALETMKQWIEEKTNS